MTLTPLVSVIMSAYNCAHVIGGAIDTVMDQDYPKLELVVVDDASTDGTRDVVEKLAAQDDRIVVFHNVKNSREGPIVWEPRNDGLKIARGEFIAYLDADNRWAPRFVSTLATALLQEPTIQLAICRSMNFYSAEEAAVALATDPRRVVASGPTWTIFDNGPLERPRLGINQYIDTNEMMHRASVFEALSGLWNTRHPRRDEIQRQMRSLRRRRRHNDLDLAERIIDAHGVASVRQVDDVLVYYYYDSFGTA